MLKNKFSLLLSAALIISLSSCYIDFRETVYGNGNVQTEERTAGSFDRLKVSSGIDVFITQGDTESIKVIADENLLKYISTEIYNNTLTVETKAWIRNAKSKEVHLVYKKLSEIDISSAGNIEGTNRMKADELDLDLSSAGDLTLDVEATRININISSAGDARLSGTVDELDADLSSAGDLNAYDLLTRKARVNASSAGSAKISASEEVDLNASSAGDIYYKGDPKTTTINRSSAGRISKK
jgi:Putative auto-transporter adhesin, head GIN domain